MKKTILFMGPPGAGKGTFAQKLISDFGVCHISTGDIFRTNIKGKTPIGLKALEFMDAGNLVPDEVTDEMVLDRIQKKDAQEKAILLDGYPRNLHQANKIVEILSTINKQLDVVIWFDVPKEVLIQRIVNRRLCKDCGKVYNIKTFPSKIKGECDKCKGQLYQRVDDTETKVMTRLGSYNKVTLPLLNHYKEEGILVKVDSNQELEKAYQQLKEFLGVK